MRLINLDTLQLEELNDNDLPTYAILSHTWDKGEVTYQGWQSQKKELNLRGHKKKGYEKILAFRDVARTYGCSYGWADTCCIDKSSSAELTEAINSMYSYYRDASICLAYLSDVSSKTAENPGNQAEQICSSRWMTRGWTLQELIAPSKVAFYDVDWRHVGEISKPLAERLENFIGIPSSVLLKVSSPSDWTVAQRLSWASRRETTRVEDQAYCLLGLFDVNIPLIYGEGERAFIRLQEEIIRRSTDHSIFAWHFESMSSRRSTESTSRLATIDQTRSTLSGLNMMSSYDGEVDQLGSTLGDSRYVQHHSQGRSIASVQTSDGSDAARRLLAPSPAYFWDCREVVECFLDVKGWIESFEMTNLGLSISLPLVPCSSKLGMYHAVLNCCFNGRQKGPIAVNLQRTSRTSTRQQQANNFDLETTTFGVVESSETESTRFHCNADHFDRLAVIEEEDLIRTAKTKLTILRVSSPSIIRGPLNETKRTRLASVKVSRSSKSFQPGRLKIAHTEDFDTDGRRSIALPKDQWDSTSNIWFVNSGVGLISFSWKHISSGMTFVFATGAEREIPFHLALFETPYSTPMDCNELMSCEYESTTTKGLRLGQHREEPWDWSSKRLSKEIAPRIDPLRLGQPITFDTNFATVNVQLERFESMSKVYHKASITVLKKQDAVPEGSPRFEGVLKIIKGAHGREVEARQHYGMIKAPVTDSANQDNSNGRIPFAIDEEVHEAESGRSESSMAAASLRRQFSFE